MNVATVERVRRQVITCDACELINRCTAPVPYAGPVDPHVVVIGEDTTSPHDRTPFSGAVGELLIGALQQAGFDPALVTTMNTVACHGGSDLGWAHINACATNKAAQLELLDPPFVLLLGNAALKPYRPDLNVRHGGRPFFEQGRTFWYTYHPATVLRISHPQVEQGFHDDLARFFELTVSTDEHRFIPDSCAGCMAFAEWWDDDLLGYCETHLPASARQAYLARLEFIQEDLERTRTEARSTASEVWRAAAGLPAAVTANTLGTTHKDGGFTEVAAARLVKPRTGTQREKALMAIADADDGLTDEELSEVTGVHQPSIAPRRVELMKQGWVQDSGRTRVTTQGAEAMVWILTPRAVDRLIPTGETSK